MVTLDTLLEVCYMNNKRIRDMELNKMKAVLLHADSATQFEEETSRLTVIAPHRLLDNLPISLLENDDYIQLAQEMTRIHRFDFMDIHGDKERYQANVDKIGIYQNLITGPIVLRKVDEWKQNFLTLRAKVIHRAVDQKIENWAINTNETGRNAVLMKVLESSAMNEIRGLPGFASDGDGLDEALAESLRMGAVLGVTVDECLVCICDLTSAPDEEIEIFKGEYKRELEKKIGELTTRLDGLVQEAMAKTNKPKSVVGRLAALAVQNREVKRTNRLIKAMEVRESVKRRRAKSEDRRTYALEHFPDDPLKGKREFAKMEARKEKLRNVATLRASELEYQRLLALPDPKSGADLEMTEAYRLKIEERKKALSPSEREVYEEESWALREALKGIH